MPPWLLIAVLQLQPAEVPQIIINQPRRVQRPGSFYRVPSRHAPSGRPTGARSVLSTSSNVGWHERPVDTSPPLATTQRASWIRRAGPLRPAGSTSAHTRPDGAGGAGAHLWRRSRLEAASLADPQFVVPSTRTNAFNSRCRRSLRLRRLCYGHPDAGDTSSTAALPNVQASVHGSTLRAEQCGHKRQGHH